MMEGEMAMTGSSALRVAVIGAGVSGLSAAQRLILNNQATMEVNIYEATDRIGGRIHTYKYGKHFKILFPFNYSNVNI